MSWEAWKSAYEGSLKAPVEFKTDDGLPIEALYPPASQTGVRAPARQTRVVARYRDTKDLPQRLTADFAAGLDRALVPLSAHDIANGADVVFVDPQHWFAAAIASWKTTRDLAADPRAAWLGGHTQDDLHDAIHLLSELAVHANKNQRRAAQVDAGIAHEAGATVVHEISYALDAGVDNLETFIESGLSPDEASSQFNFRFSLGPDPFEGVIKLRAFRWVWARAAELLGVSSRLASIEAVVGQRGLTVKGPWINALRSTTATFAALCSGVEALEVRPVDDVSPESSDMAARLARNTQLILQLESGLERVDDPTGGSGYVESLTRATAEASWSHFKEVRAAGPLTERLLGGELVESWRKDREQREPVLVGTTKFQVDNERRPPDDQKVIRKLNSKPDPITAESNRVAQALKLISAGQDPMCMQGGFPLVGAEHSYCAILRDDEMVKGAQS